MEELSSTENRVSFARQAYNDGVMHYNIFREKFPNNIIAGMFAFKDRAQLQLEPRKPARPRKSISEGLIHGKSRLF